MGKTAMGKGARKRVWKVTGSEPLLRVRSRNLSGLMTVFLTVMASQMDVFKDAFQMQHTRSHLNVDTFTHTL